MFTIQTNTTSLLTQRQLAFSSSAVKTSIERLSTGFKINRAADNASNLSISKKMNCQISGTNVAQENTQQAIGLLDTADGTLDEMTKIANRIRDLSLQSMNGTYSDEERSIMQEEVNKLTLEMYRQRNSAKYNELDIFGKKEYLREVQTSAMTAFSGGGGSLEALSNGVSAASAFDASQVTGANIDPATLGPQGTVGTYEVTKLTEEEALAQGYTVIKTADELKAMKSTGKYILMNDIDLSGVEWTAKTLNAGAELNGNGYAISNLTINSTSNTQGLFGTNNGTIKNLTVSNANVAANGFSGIIVGTNNGTVENCFADGGTLTGTGIRLGAIVGNNNGVVRNCNATSTVTGGEAGVLVGSNQATTAIVENCFANGNCNGGGLVGYNFGILRNSSTSSTVNGSGLAGGLVCQNTSTGRIENCSATGSVTSTGSDAGGLVGVSYGSIKNSIASGDVNGSSELGGLVGWCRGVDSLIENCSATGNVVASGGSVGGLIGRNEGTIKNASVSGAVSGTTSIGGLVGYNNGVDAKIENASATGSVIATGNNSGGLVGYNNQGTIENSSATGDVKGMNYVGGLVGLSSGKIDNSYALGNVESSSTDFAVYVGGFAGELRNCTVDSSYALGSALANGNRVGGFVGNVITTTISNSYAKGNATTNGYDVGGFIGAADTTTVSGCYSTGVVSSDSHTVGGFVGMVNANGLNVSNSYASGVVNSTNARVGGFVGNSSINNMNANNCYANFEQPAGVVVEQVGVTAMPASWFEDSNNLTFLGDAYDYYYNPPELWGNGEEHPEEFTQFQVGANSGEKNTLNMNMTFRMYDFYGDVTSVESSSATLERVDAFKERLSEHRSMIGSVRNRLDSVMESQSIRLENLNSSHSTIVDTDFAAETAALTRNQILQQATTSLLAQANFMPNIALQLLS